MHILNIAWDHTQSRSDFRDRVILGPENLKFGLSALLKMPGAVIREAAALMTCNRVEWYLLCDDTERALSDLMEFYREQTGFILSEQDPRPLQRLDSESVLHLFRTASGLESLMVGETQILAQVRAAYELLLEQGEKSPVFNRLFQEAIRCGKRSREETGISRGAVSVSMAAVEMSRRIFSDLNSKTVLLVGAGESAELAVKHFQTLNAEHFLIANRGRGRGEALAAAAGGTYLTLDDLPKALLVADIVVVVTASPDYLITAEMLGAAMKKRRSGSMYIADISSPRNVDPAAANVPNCFLVDMDTLDSVVEENLSRRREAVKEAAGIAAEMSLEFAAWLKTMDILPTISGLANYFDGIRKQILSEYKHKSSEENLQTMDELSRRIVQRILHNPIRYLRDQAGADTLDHREISVIWQIFKLEKMLDKYQIPKS